MIPRDVQDPRDQLDAIASENATLRAQLEQALAENERLRRALDAARRGGKRQAAPFSRNTPKADPQPAGRKSGAQYGRGPGRASRPGSTSRFGRRCR